MTRGFAGGTGAIAGGAILASRRVTPGVLKISANGFFFGVGTIVELPSGGRCRSAGVDVAW
jgi:hypothetical protein